MVFGDEDELGKRLAAREHIARESAGYEIDIEEALVELDRASDAKEGFLALQKPALRRLAILMGEGRIGAADLIKLSGMIADRVDGKVKDKVEVSGSIGLSAILADINGRSAGLPDLSELGEDLIDGDVWEVIEDNVLDTLDVRE